MAKTTNRQSKTEQFAVTPRTRIKRAPNRAVHDKKTIYDIIDATPLCHIAYVKDGQPHVTPTCHWREEDMIYWHGSSASSMIRAQKTGIPVSLCVSHLDGFVLARSGFHHSVNYRSVMIFGKAHVIVDETAKNNTLNTFIDGLFPGRSKDVRPSSKQELKGTTVLGMKIEEVSCKVRTGPPVDDETDYDLDCWAGVIPLQTVKGTPIDCPRLKPGVKKPDYL